MRGAADRDDEQERSDHRVQSDRASQDEPPGEAVGEVPRREGEDEERQELEQAHQAEVKGVATDRVDLPADRDGDHLGGQGKRKRGAPDEREVPLSQDWRKEPPHRPSRPDLSRQTSENGGLAEQGLHLGEKVCLGAHSILRAEREYLRPH